MTRLREIESLVRGKAADGRGCEDAVVLTEDFACVIDGVTSAAGALAGDATGGQLAAEAVAEVVRRASRTLDLAAFLDLVAHALGDAALRVRQAEAQGSIAAQFAVFSAFNDELWLLGDCQALFLAGDTRLGEATNPKRMDTIMSEARAAYLRAELLRGRSVEELRGGETDIGREYIKDLLQRQVAFRNSTAAEELAYWVVDGSPVPPAAAKVVKRPPGCDGIVLASDGYPVLLPSLAESEKYLASVIADDPLLIKKHKSTKGVARGAASYDDRAYLKVAVIEA